VDGKDSHIHPGAVAHTCNHSYLGGRGQEIAVRSQPWQTVHETPSQAMAGYGGSMGLSFQIPRKHKLEDYGPGPGNKARSYIKNNQCKQG
jgi:hypothetical protein